MDAQLTEVGTRLRAARQAREWTLEDLATRAGMSVSTLSRLESGKRQASLELLLPLTRELGITLDDLIVAHTTDPRIRPRIVRCDDTREVTALTPPGAPVETLRMRLHPGHGLPSPRRHDGYEWFYVLDGAVRLRLGHREVVVFAGEAAEFDTHTPHALTAEGDTPADILSIFSADGARMHTVRAQEDPPNG